MEAREMLERMRDAVCDCEGDSLEKVQAALRELVEPEDFRAVEEKGTLPEWDVACSLFVRRVIAITELEL